MYMHISPTAPHIHRTLTNIIIIIIQYIIRIGSHFTLKILVLLFFELKSISFLYKKELNTI